MCCWYAHCFHYMYIQILVPHSTSMTVRAFPGCGDFQCFRFPMQNASSSSRTQLHGPSLTLLCGIAMISLVLSPLLDCECLRALFRRPLPSDAEDRQLCFQGTALTCLSSTPLPPAAPAQGGHVEKVSLLFIARTLFPAAPFTQGCMDSAF